MKRLLLMAILYASFTSVIVLGQTPDPPPATGMPPFGSFQSGPDVVDLANLNVHFSVPILQKKGRRMNFSYGFGYDNSLWSVAQTDSGNVWANPTNWGWSAGAGGLGALISSTTLAVCNGKTTALLSYTAFIDANGTSHPFGTLTGVNGCANNQVTGTTTDGSGYTLLASNSSASVTRADGAIIGFPANTPFLASTPNSLTDSNGNQMNFSGLLVSGSPQPADGNVVLADTFGTTPLTISGQIPNPQSYQFHNPQGGTSTTSLSFKTYTFASNFQCAGIGDVGASSGQTASFPDTITLPNGSAYHFTYETIPSTSAINGRIASITLPTGGVISYQFTGANDGVNCADGTTMSLTRTTPDGEWIYTRSISSSSPSSSTTTVTDPLGNQTVYTFSGLYQTQKQIYQGSSTSGNLMRTVITCYNGNTSNCATASVALPITQKSVTVILENNQQRMATTYFNSVGNVTEKDEYDFDNGAPGPLLRKTITVYATLGNIQNRPASITICAPGGSSSSCNGPSGNGGTQVAQTTFGYDENALTATSGLPQHVAASGSRGNLTSIHRWLNTNNTTVTTSFSYDDAGQVVSSTDANRNTTTYAYQCSDAYLQKTTLPATSVAHVASATADCSSGFATSGTDQNGQISQYAYDPMFRLTQTTLPAQVVNGTAMSGSISYVYDDTPGSLSAQQTGKQNASISVVTSRFFDGLGRVNSSQVTDPAQGNIFTQTTFDPLGRVSTVTNPYRSTTDPTYGVTTKKYDALGRVMETDLPDGANKLYTFSGNASQVQGAGNGQTRVTRIFQKDGLRRLTAVCEVTAAASASGDKPSSCGLQITGKGFLTTYQYDLLGNLTAVHQGSVNRSFTYDSLSRLVSMTNPESGATTFTYDGNGNMLTRSRPAPNQGNPNQTVTTTYTYDGLNRLTGTSYSDGATPSISRHYDTSMEMGIGLDNTVGRLSAEYTISPAGQIMAGKVFSYDPLGRIINNSQCLSGCSNATPMSITYGYDLTGNELSSTDGEGHAFNYTYDSAGRLATMTSSLSDSNHPGTLFSAPSYSPVGALTAATIGGILNDAFAYDCRNRIVAYGSALAPAAPSLPGVTDSGCPVPVAADMEQNPDLGTMDSELFMKLNPLDFKAVTDLEKPQKIALLPGSTNAGVEVGQ